MPMKLMICSVVLAGGSVAFGAELLVPEQYTEINSAIFAASNGDTVSIAQGTYGPPSWGGAVADLSGKQLNLVAREGPGTVTISGGDTWIGILVSGGASSGSIIDGLTVVNASPGIWLYSTSVELQDVTIIGCSFQSGGGLKVQEGGQVTYRGGAIYNCTATSAGGGVCVESGSALLMHDTLIQFNQAVFGGGGAYVDSAYLEMSKCDFVQNSANGPFAFGGGLNVDRSGGAAFLTGCNLIGNQAPYGGGIYVAEIAHSVYLSGCFLSLNQASSGGGLCALAPMYMELCVLVDNQAAEYGGGVYAAAGGVVDGCEFVANESDNGAALRSQSLPSNPVDLSWNIFCADPPSSETVTGTWADGGHNVWACVCPADVNADDQVQAEDLMQMLRWFGASCVQCQFDLDDDEVVSVSDLLLLLDTWGPC